MAGQTVGYQFGPFLLEIGEQRLSRDGHAIPLRGKVFETLRVLIENRGHLVGKEDLIKAVWPDTVVEENNLAHNITTLRKALGEKATGQKYIETVSRRGYRFIGEVTVIGAGFADTQANVMPVDRAERTSCCLVQREAELLRLRTCLAKALDGQRQVVFVTGDAGLGKTTLVNAFVEGAKKRGGLWIGHGQCLERRGAGEPYMPVLEALGRMCREPGGEELIGILAKHAPAWLVQMPWLASDTEFELLRKKVLGTTQQRMLREMVETIEVLTAGKPLVLVLEDLHWSDHSTIDLLPWLGRRQEPARLLLIGTYRPADVKSSGHPVQAVAEELRLRCHGEELYLTFLTAAAVEEYLTSRFEGIDLPPGLATLLHRRTEGNPLFMVALVDHWVAQGSLVEEDGTWTVRAGLDELRAGVPDTLRQLIERQLGQLEAEGQQVLEAASAAGREFSATVIAAATDQTEEDVESRLDAMARQGLFVQPRGTGEHAGGAVSSQYGFIHDLHKEVLYERTPPGRRARLHQRIGRRLETTYGERSAERASELAEHFVRARDTRRAIHYLQLAAQQALERNAHREAIGHLTKALDLLGSLREDDERARREFGLQTALAPALIATKGWASADVERTLTRAEELCEQLGRPSELLPVLFGLAAMHEFRGDYRRAEAVLQQRLGLSSEEPDGWARVDSHVLMACSLFHQGAFTRAIEHADEGLTLYDPEHHLGLIASYGENPAVACHDWAALSLWFLGYPDQAVERAHRAITQALEPFHLYSLASAHTQAAFVHQFRGERSLTQKWAEATIALATERGFPYRIATGQILKGWAVAAEGHFEEGIALLNEGLKACRAAGAEMDRPYYLCLLADACSRRGPAEEGLFALAEAFDMVRGSRTFFYEAELYRLQGVLLIEAGVRSLEAVEMCFRQALETARLQRAKSLELRAAMSLARLWRQQDKPDEAYRMLSEVYGWFTEGFDTPDHRKAKALLDSVRPGENREQPHAPIRRR